MKSLRPLHIASLACLSLMTACSEGDVSAHGTFDPCQLTPVSADEPKYQRLAIIDPRIALCSTSDSGDGNSIGAVVADDVNLQELGNRILAENSDDQAPENGMSGRTAGGIPTILWPIDEEIVVAFGRSDQSLEDLRDSLPQLSQWEGPPAHTTGPSLPEACPDTDSDEVTSIDGAVSVAWGSDIEGQIECDYLSDRGTRILMNVAPTSEGEVKKQKEDLASDRKWERISLSDDTSSWASIDGSRRNYVVLNESAVLTTSMTPMAWSPAYREGAKDPEAMTKLLSHATNSISTFSR